MSQKLQITEVLILDLGHLDTVVLTRTAICFKRYSSNPNYILDANYFLTFNKSRGI